MSEITKEHIERLVAYDQETGLFRWRVLSGRRGKERATRRNAEGYNYIHLNGKEYRACRVAWLLVKGEWPKEQIDHRNGNPSDDRFANLRECSQSQNKANSRRYKNNTSGCPGVNYDPSKSKARWRATVTKDGKVHHCGWHLTKEAAIAARTARAKELHGDFASEK